MSPGIPWSSNQVPFRDPLCQQFKTVHQATRHCAPWQCQSREAEQSPNVRTGSFHRCNTFTPTEAECYICGSQGSMPVFLFMNRPSPNGRGWKFSLLVETASSCRLGAEDRRISLPRESNVRIVIKCVCVCLFRLNPLILYHKNSSLDALRPQNSTVSSTVTPHHQVIFLNGCLDAQRIWLVHPLRDFVAVVWRIAGEVRY